MKIYAGYTSIQWVDEEEGPRDRNFTIVCDKESYTITERKSLSFQIH